LLSPLSTSIARRAIWILKQLGSKGKSPASDSEGSF